MYVFVNPNGQTLVTRSELFVRSSFSLPELDNSFEALVMTTNLSPKPVIGIQGTVGGTNLLNVFGEDPLEIQITGFVVGRNCDQIAQAASALGIAIGIFAKNGVVNRTTPLQYIITGQPARQAFLVGMSVMQDNAFADYAKFNMTLLGESLQDRKLANSGAAPPPTAAGGATAVSNTGVVPSRALAVKSRVYGSSLSASLLSSTGDVLAPVSVSVSEN